MGGDDKEANDDRGEKKGGGARFCAFLVALVIVIAIVIVVLAFTVFRVRDPEVTIKTIQLKNFALTFPPSGPMLSFALGVSVNIENRNHASFKYRDSMAYIYYHGLLIGSAFIPAGKVKASATSTISSDVTIDASAFTGNPNLANDLSAGAVPFFVTTSLPGKIEVLNLVKHHATSNLKCTFSLFPQTASVGGLGCNYKLRFQRAKHLSKLSLTGAEKEFDVAVQIHRFHLSPSPLV
ncbi:hypothetical protein R1sor_006213 [Riccia sorocarpa]|uniref:Late embryogenesis abundant protein LEA-2 subgroup domain-containing protein n=1 Tax=Riccia sorocarpa TaxID=122646 RepID=A0ABD3HQA6_9MARC